MQGAWRSLVWAGTVHSPGADPQPSPFRPGDGGCVHADQQPAMSVQDRELLLRLPRLHGELLPVSKVLGAWVWAPPPPYSQYQTLSPQQWWRRSKHGQR